MNKEFYYRADADGYLLATLYLTPEESEQQGVTLREPPPSRPEAGPPGEDAKWMVVRKQRNQLLALTDWTQLPDVSLSAEQKEAWAVYRQALRDITNQTDPEHIVWPIPPEGN